MIKEHLADQQKNTNTITKDDTMMNKYLKRFIELLAELTAAEYDNRGKGA